MCPLVKPARARKGSCCMNAMLRGCWLVCCASAAFLAACQTAQSAPPGAGVASTGNFGRLIFADEFNSGSLDRSKWNVIGPDFWVNNEQQAYVDSPATIRFLPAGAVAG